MGHNTERLITAHELAQELHVSTDTVYRLARSGEIPAARIGRIWRFRMSEVHAALTAPRDPWSRSPQSAARRRSPN